MHGRIIFGVIAWLLGAATATAGSLLAVSLLGQGITGTSGPLLTGDAVSRALASESSGTQSSGTGADPAVLAGRARATAAKSAPATASATPTAAGSVASTVAGSVAGSATPRASRSSEAASTAQPVQQTTAGGVLLTSRAGDVVASCLAAGAYLDSWSPAQGYEVDTVYRGPGASARVAFEPASVSPAGSGLVMVVTCSAGIPSAVTHVREVGNH
jgi:hypothetical protein